MSDLYLARVGSATRTDLEVHGDLSQDTAVYFSH